MWLRSPEVSAWAYNYCTNITDDKNIRSLITNSKWAYLYCINKKDRLQVRKYITDPGWAYMYCVHVKNRSEMKKYIKKSHLWKSWYDIQFKKGPKILII